MQNGQPLCGKSSEPASQLSAALPSCIWPHSQQHPQHSACTISALPPLSNGKNAILPPPERVRIRHETMTAKNFIIVDRISLYAKIKILKVISLSFGQIIFFRCGKIYPSPGEERVSVLFSASGPNNKIVNDHQRNLKLNCCLRRLFS